MYAYIYIYKHKIYATVKFKSFQEFERHQGEVFGSILREKRERENGSIIFYKIKENFKRKEKI